MAFGYRRLPGGARRYINDETGETLSRRQYDEFVALQKLAKELEGENRDLKRELDRRRRQQRAAGSLFDPHRKALQRQYNALLEAYVRNQRRQGRVIGKAQARKSTEFKNAVKMIRTKRRVGESAMQREARQQARQMGIDLVGGHEAFQAAYDDQLARELDDEEMDEAA